LLHLYAFILLLFNSGHSPVFFFDYRGHVDMRVACAYELEVCHRRHRLCMCLLLLLLEMMRVVPAVVRGVVRVTPREIRVVWGGCEQVRVQLAVEG
jgi:hypothetical protein